MTSRIVLPRRQTGYPEFLKKQPDHFLNQSLTISDSAVPDGSNNRDDGISEAAKATEKLWQPFFGPIARKDLLDYQDADVQHETLPDAYDGDNGTITNIIIQQLDAHDDETIRWLAPLRDWGRRMKIRWNKIIFNNSMLRRTGEESLAHLGTHRKETQSDTVNRYGMSLLVNAAFKETQEGQEMFKYQIMQIANALISTLCFQVMFHLLNAPPHIRDDAKYRQDGTNTQAIDTRIREELDNFALLVKGPYGAETIMNMAKEQVDSHGAGSANWMRWPRRGKRYMSGQPYYMTGRRTNYSKNVESGTVVRVDDDGIVHSESKGFVISAHRANEDPQFRRRVIGGFHVMNDLNLASVPPEEFQTSMLNRRIYSEILDAFVEITYEEAMRYTGLYHQGGTGDAGESEDGQLSQLGERFFMKYDAPYWGDMYAAVGKLPQLVHQIYTRIMTGKFSYTNGLAPSARSKAAVDSGESQELQGSAYWQLFKSTFGITKDSVERFRQGDSSSSSSSGDRIGEEDDDGELQTNGETIARISDETEGLIRLGPPSAPSSSSSSSSSSPAAAGRVQESLVDAADQLSDLKQHKEVMDAWLADSNNNSGGGAFGIAELQYAGSPLNAMRMIQDGPGSGGAAKFLVRSPLNPLKALPEGVVFFAVGSYNSVITDGNSWSSALLGDRAARGRLTIAGVDARQGQQLQGVKPGHRAFFAKLDFSIVVSAAISLIRLEGSPDGSSGDAPQDAQSKGEAAARKLTASGALESLIQLAHPVAGATKEQYLKDLGFPTDKKTPASNITGSRYTKFSATQVRAFKGSETSFNSLLALIIDMTTGFKKTPASEGEIAIAAAQVFAETGYVDDDFALGATFLYESPISALTVVASHDSELHEEILAKVLDETAAAGFFSDVRDVFLRVSRTFKTDKRTSADVVWATHSEQLSKLYQFFIVKQGAHDAGNKTKLLPGIVSETQLKTAATLFLLLEYIDANTKQKGVAAVDRIAVSSYLYHSLVSGDDIILTRKASGGKGEAGEASGNVQHTSRAYSLLRGILTTANAVALFDPDVVFSPSVWLKYAGPLQSSLEAALRIAHQDAHADFTLRGSKEAADLAIDDASPEFIKWLLCHHPAFLVQTDRFWKFQMHTNGIQCIGSILTRPSQRYTMGTAVFLKAGGATAFTPVSNRRFRISTDATRDLIMGNLSVYSKTLVTDNRLLAVINDVLPQSYDGGNNTEFYDPLDKLNDVDAYERGVHYKDIFSLAVPINWQPKSYYFSITGRFPNDLDTGLYGPEELHYPTADIYSDWWHWNTSDTDPTTAGYYERANIDAGNTMVFRNVTFEYEWNSLAKGGGYTRVHKEQGHWGDTVYEGCGRVRRGKDKFFEIPSTRQTKTVHLGPY
jgi:hypothetical protein